MPCLGLSVNARVCLCLRRLVLDARVVNIPRASDPLCAACILLATRIFQEPSPCVVCCRRPREQKTLKPNKSHL